MKTQEKTEKIREDLRGVNSTNGEAWISKKRPSRGKQKDAGLDRHMEERPAEDD